MEETKYSVAERGDVTDQTAIVKRMLPKAAKLRRHYIPGGKNMMESIDRETLEPAIWNWFKHCRDFEEVTISFCENPTARDTTTTKRVEFDKNPVGPIWQTHPDRKRYLAQQIAKIISNTELVSLRATAEGIFVTVDNAKSFNPDSEDWKPYIEFLPSKRSRGEYAIY